MKKKILLKSAAVVLCMLMSAACCSCTPNDGDMEPDDDKIEDDEDEENEKESEEEPSDESIDSEHVFENRVCTDCGKTWNECFYEIMCASTGATPSGHYYDVTIVNVKNELDDNGTMEIATNGEGFFIDYETSIIDDVRISYTIRQYNDSFNNDAETYAVDFAIETHFGKFPEYPDQGQITLVTTYEGDPEGLIEAYKTGDIFNVDEPLIGYYNKELDDRLYYSSTSNNNDITLEEMFEGSEMITQEQFNQIYMDNYAIFLSTIEKELNGKGMSLHDLGIEDWK